MEIEAIVERCTRAQIVGEPVEVQSLWSGYGSIMRYALTGGAYASVIVKSISPPVSQTHPRGWNTDISHERKLRSYQVEMWWYQSYAQRCCEGCRVAKCLAVEDSGEKGLLVLEDLDPAGFAARRTRVSETELRACIHWLATLHATFLQEPAEGLWPVGCYWHLETRPDELEVLKLEDPELAAAAGALDQRLNQSVFQTVVHGDAKLANFCFSADGSAVAAVDFQYVGGGCGMKDLAYFIGSCLDEAACERREQDLLGFYFSALGTALERLGKTVNLVALELDWRALYPVAWTDFHRFLKGWSPGHRKINSYSERIAREVLSRL